MTKLADRFVIFDFDGTIADTMSLAVELGNQIMVEMGREPVSDAQVQELRSMTVRQVMSALDVPFYKVPSLVIEARSLLHNRIDDLQPIKGMPTLIADMKKANRPMGVVTTNSSENVERLLKNNDLVGSFEFINGGSGIFGKARRLKSTLKKHGLKAEDCVYVGDEIRDIEAAHKVGLEIISVTWGLNNEAGLKQRKPQYFANTTKELRSLLGVG